MNKMPVVGDVKVAPYSDLSELFRNVVGSKKDSTWQTPYTIETKSIKIYEKHVLVGDNYTIRMQEMCTFGLLIHLVNGYCACVECGEIQCQHKP